MPRSFDEEVWQDETEFNQEQYNKWLKDAIDELQLIYDTYNSDCGDIYVLGDIINMLSETQIKLDKNWELTYKRTK